MAEEEGLIEEPYPGPKRRRRPKKRRGNKELE
jgi:hypothetical protein